MRKWIVYTGTFLATCLILALPGGCTDESLRGSGVKTGKTVMVSLQVNLPPAITPGSAENRTEQVSRSGQPRQDSDAAAPFTVCLEQAQSGENTKASDSTTKLYNLWLFQFNADGTINGAPQQLSTDVTAINDRATLEVPLVVASDQTLYLLVLGPKLKGKFDQVKTLAELEKSSFEYLTSEGGYTESLITSDADVPFAGKISGITVRDIDSGKWGLVDYNTPDGFTGAIEIRRLMARITLNYKFAVENYQLQGLKLLNVNKTINLTNPNENKEDANACATLESVMEGEPDANGFKTQTWYVAQNRRGTVSTILSEDKRYSKVSGSTVLGAAPPLGTQIEAWAYSDIKPDEYAIYQMYVGNNNTSNFDVDPNHFYNLRTTINTEVTSAKNDERIRAYTAEQSINFRASAIVSGTAGAYDSPDAQYDLDAHYDTRPISIKAHGRTVTVGIYEDASATTQAPADSWLRLSSSSNYTDAFNNEKEPLGTLLSTQTLLPTELKFYLYSNEYIYNDDGTLADSGTDGSEGKRSLYIKITTATEGAGGTTQSSTIYRMDQRPAIYCGILGGEKKDGVYGAGLLSEQITESPNLYAQDKGTRYLFFGYYNVSTADAGYGTDDPDYGKPATRNLAEDPKNLSPVKSNLAQPQKNASGNILLYQYQYSNSTSARNCYDLNRDEDGDGVISDKEFKWYQPAFNQMLLGLYIGYTGDKSRLQSAGFYSTTEISKSSFITVDGDRIISDSKGISTGRRCVRDIPAQGKSPQVEIYTDERGNKYAAINLEGMLRNTEERNSDFYKDVQLYEENGVTPVQDNGADVYVKRVVRHESRLTWSPEFVVSRRFILSPDRVNSDGSNPTKAAKAVYMTMYWAMANGYQPTANSQAFLVPPPEASALQSGCPAYRGADGQDPPGTWRTPTHREAAVIVAFRKELEATKDNDTGFVPFVINNKETKYWLATEFYGRNEAWYVSFKPKETDYLLYYGVKSSTPCYLRCIRDIK